jgi:hypothetical protein
MTSPKIETIPIESLEVEEGFNVRTEKEVRENAKELAKDMQAHGGFDASAPITYVQRGKEKIVRSGHTRLAAAKSLGFTDVYAVKVEDEYLASLVNLITSNNGHPVSRKQQGSVYARLRDGVLEDESETIRRTKVGEEPSPEYIHQPMAEKDIAASFHRSGEHIRQCIAIHEAPEEIAEMLESDQISANIFVTAMQWAKQDSAKAKKILKRAIAVAKDEGSETATKKHLDSIKSEFVELKAAAPSGKNTQEAKAGSDKPTPDHPEDIPGGFAGNTAKNDAPSLDIGGENTPKKANPGPDKLSHTLAAILRQCSEEYSWAATDSDIEGCVEKLMEVL